MQQTLISMYPVNRVFKVLCVTQLAKIVYFYLSYNAGIFIIFTEGYYITAAYRGGGGGFEVFKPPSTPEIPKAFQNCAKQNPICENC